MTAAPARATRDAWMTELPAEQSRDLMGDIMSQVSKERYRFAQSEWGAPCGEWGRVWVGGWVGAGVALLWLPVHSLFLLVG